jgi:hypothetical protein
MNRSIIISEYFAQTKKKWFTSSCGTVQVHIGLDKKRKETVHISRDGN